MQAGQNEIPALPSTDPTCQDSLTPDLPPHSFEAPPVLIFHLGGDIRGNRKTATVALGQCSERTKVLRTISELECTVRRRMGISIVLVDAP